jgi:hypothetical protein
VHRDGLDGALITLSSPLGIESLPSGEAEPLLEAFHLGVQALGAPFGWWGAVALDRPEADAVDRLLAAGATGISMPAGALASPRGLDRVGPLLERVERHGAPLFVHPGPAPWRPMAWTGSAFPHVGDAPAVTIHAYSPALWRMGAYQVLASGELRRHSVSYAEELRPLTPAAP